MNDSEVPILLIVDGWMLKPGPWIRLTLINLFWVLVQTIELSIGFFTAVVLLHLV